MRIKEATIKRSFFIKNDFDTKLRDNYVIINGVIIQGCYLIKMLRGQKNSKNISKKLVFYSKIVLDLSHV